MNSALLLTLVWTFTAVCQAEDGVSVSCEDVTGSVGKEVTFTCSITLLKTDCCIIIYKFLYPEKVNDSFICKEEPPKNPCDQRNTFTCSYTPATAMSGPYRFFLQTKYRPTTTEFTVNIADKAVDTGNMNTSKITEDPNSASSKHAAIAAAVSCISIALIIIIIMTIICKTKPNFTKPCGLQRRMSLCIKHDEENTTPPEDPAAQDLIRCS